MEELQGLMVDVKNTVVSHSLRGNKSGSVKYPPHTTTMIIPTITAVIMYIDGHDKHSKEIIIK